MTRGPHRRGDASSSSFRGASKAREPGIQKEAASARLDSGSGAEAPSRNDSAKVLVARIGAAHGVRGEMKFWSFTEDPEAVADYGPFETLDGKRSFEIEQMRAAKDHFVVRLSGVADRTAAEKLTNTDLYVPRDRLPAIDEDDTYYHADLIGLAAVTPEGVALGKVTGLFNFGAGDLIEIATPQGGEPMLLPFTNAVVPDVDIKAGKITIVLPSIIE